MKKKKMQFKDAAEERQFAIAVTADLIVEDFEGMQDRPLLKADYQRVKELVADAATEFVDPFRSRLFYTAAVHHVERELALKAFSRSDRRVRSRCKSASPSLGK